MEHEIPSPSLFRSLSSSQRQLVLRCLSYAVWKAALSLSLFLRLTLFLMDGPKSKHFPQRRPRPRRPDQTLFDLHLALSAMSALEFEGESE